jgi:hypothetical protein
LAAVEKFLIYTPYVILFCGLAVCFARCFRRCRGVGGGGLEDGAEQGVDENDVSDKKYISLL